MELIDLLDLVIDDCLITIFDTDKGKNIQENLSLDEAKEWAEEHSCEVGSFEPSPTNGYDRGITFNVSEVE